MTTSPAPPPPPSRARRAPPARPLGRVLAVSGAQVTVGLTPTSPGSDRARHRRQIPRRRQRRHRHRRPDHRNRRAPAAASRIPTAAAPRGSTWSARSRRTPPAPRFPARHHRISDDRRAGDADDRSRAAADLQRHQHQPSNIGVLQQDPTHPGAGRHRAARQQALRRGRHHRRRQIERRRHPAAANSRRAARSAHLPDRSAQRIRPLLRRQGAGADAAQSAAAVLAVQLRGNGRRVLRRPSRHRRRGRDSFGGDPGGQGRLCAAQGLQRPRADEEEGPARPPATASTRRCRTASKI